MATKKIYSTLLVRLIYIYYYLFSLEFWSTSKWKYSRKLPICRDCVYEFKLLLYSEFKKMRYCVNLICVIVTFIERSLIPRLSLTNVPVLILSSCCLTVVDPAIVVRSALLKGQINSFSDLKSYMRIVFLPWETQSEYPAKRNWKIWLIISLVRTVLQYVS